MTRQPVERLGIDVHTGSGCVLEGHTNGTVARWNQANPQLAKLKGDYVLEVGGVRSQHRYVEIRE